MAIVPAEHQRAQVARFLERHRIGLLTLLFTDIVGSTRLKQELGDQTAVALIQEHHALLREVLGAFPEAEEIGTAGDSFFLVFCRPSDAVRFSLLFLRQLRVCGFENGRVIEDRIGIHVGEVFIEEREDGPKRKDLYGIQVDTCARVMSMALPGQILMTRFASDNSLQVLRGSTVEGVGEIVWLNHGLYDLKGVEDPLEICEVGETGLGLLVAPPDSEKASKHRAAQMRERVGWRPTAGAMVPGTAWALVKKLGEGGFGEVWKATNERAVQPEGDCAFKFTFRPEGLGLLESAVKLDSKLKTIRTCQEGILAIHEFNLKEAPHWVRMDLIEGMDIAEWCQSDGGVTRRPLAERVGVLLQAAQVLMSAHKAGVVHGDIKPSNLLLGKNAGGGRRMWIGDFGSTAEVGGSPGRQTSMFVGSALYLAPEQTERNGMPTVSSDIYSFGAVMYELLVGRPPFVRPTVAALFDAHRYEEPRLPCLDQSDVPDALQRICLKALEKKPAERYRTMNELVADLRRFMTGQPVLVRPSQYDNAVASRMRKHQRELAQWRRERLLTDAEYARLAGVYQRFDRTGAEAVLQARRLHPLLVALLTGGWMIIDATSLWLATQWDDLGRWSRVGIGWLPVLLLNGLWAVFWRRGCLRAAHVMMLLGAVSLPVACQVLLDSWDWLSWKLGNPSIALRGGHNAQLMASLAVGIGWAMLLMKRTRTLAVSVLAAMQAVLLYLLVVDTGNIKELLDSTPAGLALRLLPFSVVAFTLGQQLARHRASRRQAVPWYSASLATMVACTLALAWYVPGEWLLDRWGIPADPRARRSAFEALLRGGLVMGCGVTYGVLGWRIRKRFLVEARMAYSLLLWLAPICVLGGVTLASSNWTEDWPHIGLFGLKVPLAEAVLFCGALGCVAWAPRLQIRFHVFVGLVFLGIAEWMIGMRFFDDRRPAWAVSLLIFGTVVLCLSSWMELRRRASSPWQEMDDTLEPPVKPPDVTERPRVDDTSPFPGSF